MIHKFDIFLRPLLLYPFKIESSKNVHKNVSTNDPVVIINSLQIEFDIVIEWEKNLFSKKWSSILEFS